VGNSSSGIHEAASLGVPTVNIGSRQQGRERPESVLDVPHDAGAIEAALRTALHDDAFRKKVRACVNPYGDGHAAEKIVDILARISLDGLVQKIFYDGPAA
jgi:UDP-N-acetylglucosamine 2-epimerase (non-hydrolysing)/GDP/UDP-N,N'-diacetylbacillosamine 2-epimerase (hydrolysing)